MQGAQKKGAGVDEGHTQSVVGLTSMGSDAEGRSSRLKQERLAENRKKEKYEINMCKFLLVISVLWTCLHATPSCELSDQHQRPFRITRQIPPIKWTCEYTPVKWETFPFLQNQPMPKETLDIREPRKAAWILEFDEEVEKVPHPTGCPQDLFAEEMLIRDISNRKQSNLLVKEQKEE